MEVFSSVFDLFLHLDKYLVELVNQFGLLTYLILFAIIFAETGLVVTPFLPGDSLLFAAGSLAAKDSLNPVVLFSILSFAAIAGDTVNYWIGSFIGPKAFQDDKSRFFKKEYLRRTEKFYEKHGGKTIILARFIPIVRTFAPFVAGIGSMDYAKFLSYNIVGGLLWVGIFVFGGYFFGSLDFVEKNFSLVIVVVVLISLAPIAWEYILHRRGKNVKKKP